MISIIIPTLNEEKIIEKTLSYLLTLPKNEFEIIISDGGSSDKTIELAKKYTDKIFILKEKHNISGGRNFGAKYAKGDFLVFLDADVFILNPVNFFNKALNEFEKNKNLVALTSRLKILPQNETLTDKFFHFLIDFIHWFSCNVLNLGNASGEFQMIKADAFWRIGGFDEKLVVSEDADLFFRLSKIGKVKTIWSLVVYHTGRRIHKEGWPKILWHWLLNFFSWILLKKSYHKKWKEIR
ncbi:MAG: glycosyltransferase [bacterium]|nr:glycosyltransferase [bacterium]